MSIRRSSLICVAYLQVYERVADNRWWPNIGGYGPDFRHGRKSGPDFRHSLPNHKSWLRHCVESVQLARQKT